MSNMVSKLVSLIVVLRLIEALIKPDSKSTKEEHSSKLARLEPPPSNQRRDDTKLHIVLGRGTKVDKSLEDRIREKVRVTSFRQWEGRGNNLYCVVITLSFFSFRLHNLKYCFQATYSQFQGEAFETAELEKDFSIIASDADALLDLFTRECKDEEVVKTAKKIAVLGSKFSPEEIGKLIYDLPNHSLEPFIDRYRFYGHR